MTEPIYHIALPEEWEAARSVGRYEQSTRGLGLADVGFIHCSTSSQVIPTAERFYADLDDELAVLVIDTTRLADPVRFEPVPSGEEFPHLYGALPVEAVTAVRWLRRGPDGRFELT